MELTMLALMIVLVAVTCAEFATKQFIQKSKEIDIKEEEVSIDRIKILLEDNSFEKINNVLDAYIQDAGNMYSVFTVTYDAEERYMNSEQQEEMSKYIKAMVKRHMTKENVSLLSLIYKIDSQEDIDRVLDLRIKLYMINVVIENNSDLL